MLILLLLSEVALKVTCFMLLSASPDQAAVHVKPSPLPKLACSALLKDQSPHISNKTTEVIYAV